MIKNIRLLCFRNHLDFFAEINTNFVIIGGDNGVGKTNILEAISLFSPGKSFRNCKFEEIVSKNQNYSKEWGVHINFKESIFSTGYNVRQNRKIKKDAVLLSSQSEILNDMRVLWLLPQMENIFNAPSSSRRRFFDRICYNLFPEHARNVLRYEYFLKSRIKILQNDPSNHEWLCSIEKMLAETSVKVQSIRIMTLEIIKNQLNEIGAQFLRPTLNLINLLEFQNDKDLIENFKQYRAIDMRSGRSNFGPHKTDLAIQNYKGHSASYCSTGEQKAILVSLFLAQATAIRNHSNIEPIMLLDEVLAHFDDAKQVAILSALEQLASQVWITTTKKDTSLFQYIKPTDCTYLKIC